MARRMSFPGVEEYITKLETLGVKTEGAVNKAVAAGAKPIADQCKANIKALHRVTDNWALVLYNRSKKKKTSDGQKDESKNGNTNGNKDVKMELSDSQKEGLLESMGLAPIVNSNGYINTKLGFDGYNKVVTKRWPKGQPNAMIARSLESGSTAFDKHPFIRPAIAAKKAEAEKAMQETLDREISKIMK